MSGTIFCIFIISAPKTMSKRMQEEKGEEIIVAKSKPTLNLVSQAVASSSTAPSSSASKRPRKLKESNQGLSRTAGVGRLAAEDSNYNDASSSQVWLTDAKANDSARRLAATETNQNLDFQKCKETCSRKSRRHRRRLGGRTTSTYLVLTFHISRKSSRIFDSNSVASHKTKWKFSM